MSITVCCNNEKCEWSTDIELISETNPYTCPRCGDEIMIEGGGIPLYGEDREYNSALYDDEDDDEYNSCECYN